MKKMLLLNVCFLFFLYSHSQAGSFDPSFGGSGKAFNALYFDNGGGPQNFNSDFEWAITVQPDGKIILVGRTNVPGNGYDFGVLRFNTDGSPDVSFGEGGQMNINFNTGSPTSIEDQAFAVIVQPDGKIIVGGHESLNGVRSFGLARLNADGSLDITFNGGGKVMTPFGPSPASSAVYALALQPDGKIIAGGNTSTNGTLDFAVARYNIDGTLDNTFNGTGKVITYLGPGDEYLQSIAVQPDGKIVAFGNSSYSFNSDFALVRYNADGSLDNSFDVDGIVTTAFGTASDLGIAMKIQPDSKILVAGYGRGPSSVKNDVLVARYNTNGSLDNTLNGTGKVVTNPNANDDFMTGLVLQADGKFVVTGYTPVGFSKDLLLVRYNSNGTLDNSFNGNGKAILDMGGNEISWGAALMNNRIYIGATTDQPGFNSYGVAAVQTGLIVLPLTLNHFAATLQAGSVRLSWNTSNEAGFSHFVIEQSVNGLNFHAIGSVPSSGGGQGTHEYSFIDGAVQKPTSYYRLAMIDADGKKSYSGIVKIKLDDAAGLTVYPNPTTTKLKILSDEIIQTVRIIDASGRTILKKNMSGGHSIELNVSGYARGIYFAEIIDINNKKISRSFSIGD